VDDEADHARLRRPLDPVEAPQGDADRDQRENRKDEDEELPIVISIGARDDAIACERTRKNRPPGVRCWASAGAAGRLRWRAARRRAPAGGGQRRANLGRGPCFEMISCIFCALVLPGDGVVTPEGLRLAPRVGDDGAHRLLLVGGEAELRRQVLENEPGRMCLWRAGGVGRPRGSSGGSPEPAAEPGDWRASSARASAIEGQGQAGIREKRKIPEGGRVSCGDKTSGKAPGLLIFSRWTCPRARAPAPSRR
jgi:hypothetical protein